MKKFLFLIIMFLSSTVIAAPTFTENPNTDSPNYPYYISSDTGIMYGNIGGAIAGVVDSSDTYAFFWDGGVIVLNTFGVTSFDSVISLYTNQGLFFGSNDNAYNGTTFSQLVRYIQPGFYQVKIESVNPLNQQTQYQINRNFSSNGIVSGITPVIEPVNAIPEPGMLYLIGLIGTVILARKYS